jgi:hypothetical protein
LTRRSSPSRPNSAITRVTKSSSPSRGRMLRSSSAANSTSLGWAAAARKPANTTAVSCTASRPCPSRRRPPREGRGGSRPRRRSRRHQGIGAGRQVAHGQGDPPHPGRDRAQDRPLGDLSDPGDPHKGLVPLGATMSDEGSECAANSHLKAAQQVVGGGEDAIGDAKQTARPRAYRPTMAVRWASRLAAASRGRRSAGRAGPCGCRSRRPAARWPSDQHRDQHRPGLDLHGSLLAVRGGLLGNHLRKQQRKIIHRCLLSGLLPSS